MTPFSDPPPSWQVTLSRVVKSGREKIRLFIALGIGACVVVVLLLFALGIRFDKSSSSSRSATTVDSVTPATDTGSELVVYVTGAVVHSGVFRINANFRVIDAVSAAGGSTPDAAVEGVNMAAKLSDGQRIYIPRKNEINVNNNSTSSNTGESNQNSPININTASSSELDGLPGVGPATAQAILSYRQQHNGFRSINELRNITGIGDAKFAKLRPLVTV